MTAILCTVGSRVYLGCTAARRASRLLGGTPAGLPREESPGGPAGPSTPGWTWTWKGKAGPGCPRTRGISCTSTPTAGMPERAAKVDDFKRFHYRWCDTIAKPSKNACWALWFSCIQSYRHFNINVTLRFIFLQVVQEVHLKLYTCSWLEHLSDFVEFVSCETH